MRLTPTITGLVIVVCSAMLVAAACEQRPKPAPMQPAASEPAAAPGETQPAALEPELKTPTVPAHMADHFTRGASMRDAVIAGDLVALRKDAQWMAEHELSATLAQSWQPHVDRVQACAKKALDARSISVAALAVAETAGSCGSCHAALGGPKLEIGKPPAEASGAKAHMARHQWAAERMWDALSTPSEEAWIAATEAMADAPLVPKAVSGERSVDDKVEKLASEVHAIAERARMDRDMRKWEKAYANLLATCAQCHQAVGVKSKSP
jgi:cytochrome c556